GGAHRRARRERDPRGQLRHRRLAPRRRRASHDREIPGHVGPRRRRESARFGVPRRRRRPVSMTAVSQLLELTPDAARAALGEWLAARGEPAYRLRQVLPRLWQRPVGSWADATELPAALRAALADAFPLFRLTLATRQVSSDGTEKF